MSTQAKITTPEFQRFNKRLTINEACGLMDFHADVVRKALAVAVSLYPPGEVTIGPAVPQSSDPVPPESPSPVKVTTVSTPEVKRVSAFSRLGRRVFERDTEYRRKTENESSGTTTVKMKQMEERRREEQAMFVELRRKLKREEKESEEKQRTSKADWLEEELMKYDVRRQKEDVVRQEEVSRKVEVRRMEDERKGNRDWFAEELAETRRKQVEEEEKKKKMWEEKELDRLKQQDIRQKKEEEEAVRRAEEAVAKDLAHREVVKAAEEEQHARQAEEEEKRKSLHSKKLLYDGIHANQKEWRENYQRILELFKTTRYLSRLKEAVPNATKVLSNVNEEFIKLADLCKKDLATEEDLARSRTGATKISLVLALLLQHQDKFENEDMFEMEIASAKADTKSEVPGQVVQPTDIITEEMVEEEPTPVEVKKAERDDEKPKMKLYQELAEELAQTEKILEPFLADESQKKFRNDCRKAVNTPVNAISAVSGAHMQDKLRKLSGLLTGDPVPVKEHRFTSTLHPLGVLYCTYLLAVKFVKQGEQTVSSKADAAFSIASVAVALWSEFPKFGRLLLAQFHRVCPYLIPHYPPRLPQQSDQEYYRSLGFLYTAEGQEDLNMFLKRMSGVMRLYCSLVVSPPRGRHPPPIGPAEAWHWLAAFINLEPRADVSATLILDMLEVTGNTMLREYRLQFQKLLHLICKSVIPKMEQVTPEGRGGPVSRLKCFLETVICSRSIPPPKGILPPNFW